MTTEYSLDDIRSHFTGPRDPVEIKMYQKYAEQGDPEAQYYLALCYIDGDGLSKDINEAVRYYKLAAEKGLMQAQFSLAICYRNGSGVPKDMSEMLRLFAAAASQGHGAAQYALAFHYRSFSIIIIILI